jgi:hypothetical protein
MLELDLPRLSHNLKTRNHEGSTQVFDPVRKKWIILTLEELVRQSLILYFIDVAGFPAARISVERQIMIHGLRRRYDLVLWDKQAQPSLLVECKAPSVPVTQSAMDQIARYNIALRVPYLFVTNGTTSYCCAIDFDNEAWTFMDQLPRLI